MRFARAFFLLLASLAVVAAVVVPVPASDAATVAVAGRAAAAAPLVSGPDDCGRRLRKAEGGWWECSFVDDFDGTELDGTKWSAGETAVSGVTNGGASCYLRKPWTLAVDGGLLRLSAKRTLHTFLCRNPLGDFRTNLAAATVSTRGKFAQAYGRFAFRARMPDVTVSGAHAALWLYPNRNTYGAWPQSGEIDVAEWYSALSDQVYPSLHYVDGLRNVQTGEDTAFAAADRFHTYAVEWTPTTMRFYYDDVLTYQHSWSPLAPLVASQPFDQPFNVVLTQAWGGLWNAATADTPDRFTLLVDWVKVWQ
ncbi:family 16 glycosylhydrolase [Nocardioides sp. MH1]|uniref:glycoside hydrolase family 16 protein n=1 Tax=Nocardioides sp. MH1 TaxID=3242490 RepID=UPI003523004D